MTEENKDQENNVVSDSELSARYHRSLVSEIQRINAAYPNLDSMSIETLEALKAMELEKVKKANEKPEPFTPVKKGQASAKSGAEPKANEAQDEVLKRFNRLQVFHPQYTPVEIMGKYKQNCTIFTMMVNPDPRFPEWQVS